MINLYLDGALMANFKVGESKPKGFMLPKFSDLAEQSWHATTLSRSNVFPGVEYQIDGAVVVLMPTKKNPRIYAATIA